ncbi:MAG: hypothetical protein GTO18_15395 [Anaerolineales bacterium]|nr:hypothetical protein [Anaerolineales bacterium]
MPIQTIAILISLLALIVSIGSFLSSRQAAWSIRYFERWFQLAKIVLDNPDTLLPLWCNPGHYQQLFAKDLLPDREPRLEELVFAEMYVDFVLEVNRRGPVAAFLTGRFPGRVPMANLRTQWIWDKYVRLLYPEKDQKIVDRVIARSK